MADTPEELKKLAVCGRSHYRVTGRVARYDPSFEDGDCEHCEANLVKLTAAYALGLSDMQERAAKLFDGSGLEAEFGVARRIRALRKEG